MRRLSWRPRRWGHWTLRSRLVLVVGGLAAIALIVANAAGLLLIRSYLQDRVDEQLEGMSRPFANAQRLNPPPPNSAGPRNRQLRLGADQVVYVYSPAGTLDPDRSSTVETERPTVAPLAEVLAHAGTGRP